MKKIFTIVVLTLLIGVGCDKQEEVLGVVDVSKTIEVWNGEVKMTISYPLVGGEVILGGGDKEIMYDSKDKQVRMYNIDIGETYRGQEYKNGGYEMDVVLKTKPKTNKVEFDIDSTDLVFYYQAPLNEAQANGKIDASYTCTATQCKNKDGNAVFKRPENVVDSYAVYHSTKRNHKIGETNYGSGKAFHIYRSKIFDANNDWTWAENMNYANGKLTVTVPQKFLSQAVYPVTVDPNLGFDTAGASQGDLVHDNIALPGWGSDSGNTMIEAGTAISVWWYTGGGGTVDSMKAAIYDESGGTPNGLLDESTGNPTYNASTAGWSEFTGFSASLSNSSDYYPAIWGTHDWDNMWIYYDGSDFASDLIYNDAEAFGSWPTTLAESVGNDWVFYSAYIEYSTGGGGGDPPVIKNIADIIIF